MFVQKRIECTFEPELNKSLKNAVAKDMQT